MNSFRLFSFFSIVLLFLYASVIMCKYESQNKVNFNMAFAVEVIPEIFNYNKKQDTDSSEVIEKIVAITRRNMFSKGAYFLFPSHNSKCLRYLEENHSIGLFSNWEAIVENGGPMLVDLGITKVSKIGPIKKIVGYVDDKITNQDVKLVARDVAIMATTYVVWNSVKWGVDEFFPYFYMCYEGLSQLLKHRKK